MAIIIIFLTKTRLQLGYIIVKRRSPSMTYNLPHPETSSLCYIDRSSPESYAV